jgi:hypothetical protein
MRYFKQYGITAVQGTAGDPLEVKQQGGGAYIIVPITWAGTLNGKPFTQGGTYTFTLRKNGDAWLITSQSWLSKS